MSVYLHIYPWKVGNNRKKDKISYLLLFLLLLLLFLLLMHLLLLPLLLGAVHRKVVISHALLSLLDLFLVLLFVLVLLLLLRLAICVLLPPCLAGNLNNNFRLLFTNKRPVRKVDCNWLNCWILSNQSKVYFSLPEAEIV